jgi:hypothetical protein
MNVSNFLPMSPAMQRSDAVPSHREALSSLSTESAAAAAGTDSDDRMDLSNKSQTKGKDPVNFAWTCPAIRCSLAMA